MVKRVLVLSVWLHKGHWRRVLEEPKIKGRVIIHDLGDQPPSDPLVENGPQADPLVLGPGSQQPLLGLLVVGEGHTLHHVTVILKHRQRSQLLPAKHPDSVVPAA